MSRSLQLCRPLVQLPQSLQTHFFALSPSFNSQRMASGRESSCILRRSTIVAVRASSIRTRCGALRPPRDGVQRFFSGISESDLPLNQDILEKSRGDSLASERPVQPSRPQSLLWITLTPSSKQLKSQRRLLSTSEATTVRDLLTLGCFLISGE